MAARRSLALFVLSGALAAAACHPVGALVTGGVLDVVRCAPDTPVDSQTRFEQTDTDAIVVLGAAQIYGMTFLSGIDDGVDWRPTHGPTVTARTDNGFVVARLKARRGKHRYAIGRVSLQPEATDCYAFPSSSQLLIFNAPPGQVTYLGAYTVAYTSEGGVNRASLRADPAVTQTQANAYLVRRFPLIKPALVTGPTEWVYRGVPE
ncbi:MAG TPA: hypothetical protein VIQ54_06305 [Polyangia bacterium]|jgi:hypothetical protein